MSLLKDRRDMEEEIGVFVPEGAAIVVLDLVAMELERLVRVSSSTVRGWASLSLNILYKKKYPIRDHRPGPSDVDSALISFALGEKTPTYVATIDRQLRSALLSFGLPTISPRMRYGLRVERRPSSGLNKSTRRLNETVKR